VDKYLVSIAFILLCFECGWLLQDLKIVNVPSLFESQFHIEAGDPMGEIVHTKKQVRRRPNSSIVWEETAKSQSLYAYDAVLTLEQSAAEVSLIGDTHITLNENTLVTIEPPNKNTTNQGPIRLRFKQGSMRAAIGRTPQSMDAGDWIVEASAKTKIAIRSDGQNKFELETYEGEARILDGKTMATKETIKAGQSVRMEPEKLSEVKEVLSLEWISPKDGERFYTHSQTIDVPFQWKGKASGLKIFDHEKLHPRDIKFAQADIGEERLSLPRGNYVVRMQNDSALTFARIISVWPAPKIHLVSPMTRERIKFKTDIGLLWTQNREAKNYIWEIATDEKFQNIIRTGQTLSNSAEVEDLPLGQFFWRVRAQDDQGFNIPEIYHNTFYILEKPLAAPKLKAPQIKMETGFNFWQWLLPEAQAADRPGRLPKKYSAEFQWEHVDGAESYVIEISETPDFRNLLSTKTVKKPSYKWHNFPLGKYYWRVAGQAQGEIGLFSEVAYADLTVIPQGPITPVTKEVVEEHAKDLTEKIALSGPSPTPRPSVAPEPTAAALPTATPTPAQVAAKPTPTPPLKHEQPLLVWGYEVQVGASGKYTHYRGPDFTARELGPVYGLLRVAVTPDHSFSTWRMEGELERHTLRAKDPNAVPFQAPITRYMGRLTFIDENPYKDHASYGLAVHTQTFIYRRSDLEILDAYTPVFVGPVIDWRYFDKDVESDYRLGAFIGDPFTGKAISFEGSANRTWLFKLPPHLIYSITIEGKITTGVTLEKSFWGDGTGSLFLGVRW
jgi:hypothetical protein